MLFFLTWFTYWGFSRPLPITLTSPTYSAYQFIAREAAVADKLSKSTAYVSYFTIFRCSQSWAVISYKTKQKFIITLYSLVH